MAGEQKKINRGRNKSELHTKLKRSRVMPKIERKIECKIDGERERRERGKKEREWREREKGKNKREIGERESKERE